MRTAWRRWAVVAALLAGLVAAPSLAGALPARSAPGSAADLLARVRASGTVAFSGYGESRGTLVLPDVRELGDLPALVGGTTRTRVWWRGPLDNRVDALTLAGERDVSTGPGGSWDWSSADHRALRLRGRLDVHLPLAGDLVAPVLARRLAGATDVVASRLPARRVAGRSAAGLRLVPRNPATTSVRSVDIWADQASGLPLSVAVLPVGQRDPALQAELLDVSLQPPAAARTAFSPPPGSSVQVVDAPDVAAQADRFAPYVLPGTLAGLPRQQRVTALRTGGGVATYGEGLTALVVLPLPRDVAAKVIDRLAPTGAGTSATLSTPLVNAVFGTAGRRAYLVAGTVPVPLLERAFGQLRDDPPPRVP